MLWVSLERISPHLKNAVLIAEDERFFLHHGVDMHEAKKARPGRDVIDLGEARAEIGRRLTRLAG